MKVGTHDGIFHADDVMAIAILHLVRGSAGFVLVRTRDKAVLDTCDALVDVGAEYDPDRGKYDHHQKGGAGERVNGLPYASVGLVWKTYGFQVVTESLEAAGIHLNYDETKEIQEVIDDRFFSPIDAADCGYDLAKEWRHPDVRPLTLSSVISGFNPRWDESSKSFDYDQKFAEAVKTIALPALKHAVAAAVGTEKARSLVRSAERKCDDKVLVLPSFCPWQDEVLSNWQYVDTLYVIFRQAGEGRETWMVQCIPDKPGSFGKRKALPAAWAGLRDKALQDATGVTDSIFCHPGSFICGAGSLAGALSLAEKAVQA